MAAPHDFPTVPAYADKPLRTQITLMCKDIVDSCSFASRTLKNENPHAYFDFTECINERKDAILIQFGRYIAAIIEEYPWPNAAQGGKRKRRTRHRKRFHKKNRTRRHRRVR